MSVLTMPTLNGMGKSAVSVVAIAAVMTLFLNMADSRYAMASDVKDMKASFYDREIQLIEDDISIIEDDIDIIQSEDVLTTREKTKLSKLKNRKAKYLRRLTGIKASPR